MTKMANFDDKNGGQDWRERLKAEYWQVKTRYEELRKFCIKYEAGTLTFIPNCSLSLFEKQANAMADYIRVLEIRAEIEHIDLMSKDGVLLRGENGKNET